MNRNMISAIVVGAIFASAIPSPTGAAMVAPRDRSAAVMG